MSIDDAKEILYGPGSPARVMPWDNLELGIEGSRVLLENLKHRSNPPPDEIGEILDGEALIPVLDLMLTTMEGIYEQLRTHKHGGPL